MVWSGIMLLVVHACISLIAFRLIFKKPLPQDQEYHNFADQVKKCCCVPNFNDVFSNVPFLVVGIAGVLHVPFLQFHNPYELLGWLMFFSSIILVSFGSAYYHWTPNDETLIWDRLPMTLAFMTLYGILLEERVTHALFLIVPFQCIGLWSVCYWRRHHDLRPYAAVQFYWIFSLPWLFWLFQERYTHQYYIWYSVAMYALAKLCEMADHRIYRWTRCCVSGHTLKHLSSCGAICCVLVMLVSRHT